VNDTDKEAIRNEVLAECAQALRARANEWMDVFNAPEVDEDSKSMSFYNAMQCDDCAHMIESLCPDVKLRRAAQRAKICLDMMTIRSVS
jgi:hypothetical protein